MPRYSFRYLQDTPNRVVNKKNSSHRECQFEQDLDYSQTRRQLSYRRKKDEMKKKLARLEKLQKIIQEKEEATQQGGERGGDRASLASAAAVSVR